MLEMTTTRGTRYLLEDDGRVVDRTDGPRGWNYSGKWIILGFKKRHHSAFTFTLAEALAGEDVGQGWITDLDHGTVRLWGGERLRSIRRMDQ
jgi:hypothetical protein